MAYASNPGAGGLGGSGRTDSVVFGNVAGSIATAAVAVAAAEVAAPVTPAEAAVAVAVAAARHRQVLALRGRQLVAHQVVKEAMVALVVQVVRPLQMAPLVETVETV